MQINKTKISIIKGDITEVKVDVIVNASNRDLVMDKGLASVIKKKGGDEIEIDALKKAPIDIGAAIETTAGTLSMKYVIHAATVDDDSKTNEVIIRDACRNSLLLAKKLRLKFIAFPALGCGEGGFSPKTAAKIMSQEAFKHAKYDTDPLEHIYFVLFDQETFDIFEKQSLSYLNHIENKLCQGPFITVDIIIEVPASPAGGEDGIVLIERSNPPFGWAVPGGFLDYGETLEHCAIREAKEETNLDIYNLEQMHTYSDPKRDPRFHTVTTVFVAKAKGKPKAGDDAQKAKIVSLEEIPSINLAFDHSDVLEDYKRFKQRK